jgi:hypothetical protein
VKRKQRPPHVRFGDYPTRDSGDRDSAAAKVLDSREWRLELRRKLRISSRSETSSRSECKPKLGMLRGCRLVSRSERAGGGTGSARRRFVPLPTAIGLVRCRVRCCASQEKGQCGGHADLGGLPRRHSPCRPMRNQDDGAVLPALPAMMEWHQPARGLAASRYDWLR